MPPQRVLLTGASGYLGGTLLSCWSKATLPPHDKLFALVRSKAQSEAVQRYNAEPIEFDVTDKAAVESAITENRITIVFFLIDAVQSTAQVNFIEALAKMKKEHSGEVHFVHTSGAKIFSSHAGAPIDRPLLDTAEELYAIQKRQVGKFAPMQQAVETNNAVIERSEALGVRAYIFIPCIVYGKAEGFGNPISIQTRAVVKAAKAIRKVCRVNSDGNSQVWPVCHVIDNAELYLCLLREILAEKSPPYGKNGYYLAASGSILWDEIYSAFASALAKRGVVDAAEVYDAEEEQLEQMGAALGIDAGSVALQLSGCCMLMANRGIEIGWKARYKPEHILSDAQEEVDRILAELH